MIKTGAVGHRSVACFVGGVEYRPGRLPIADARRRRYNTRWQVIALPRGVVAQNRVVDLRPQPHVTDWCSWPSAALRDRQALARPSITRSNRSIVAFAHPMGGAVACVRRCWLSGPPFHLDRASVSMALRSAAMTGPSSFLSAASAALSCAGDVVGLEHLHQQLLFDPGRSPPSRRRHLRLHGVVFVIGLDLHQLTL